MKRIIFTAVLLFTTTAESKKYCAPDSYLEKIFLPDGDRVKMEVIDTQIRHMDLSIINETKSGKHFDFWIDENNHIHFSETKKTKKRGADFTLLRNSDTKDAYVIKSSGEFYYDAHKKDFVYKTKKTMDVLPNETDEAIRAVSKEKYSREFNPAWEESRVVKCTEILAKQQKGDKFVFNSVASGTAVTATAFATSEIFNLSDKPEKDRWNMFKADLSVGLVRGTMLSHVAKKLTLKNASIPIDFGTKVGTEFATSWLVKRPIYKHFNPSTSEDPHKEEIANKIVPYDTAYSIVRFFPKRMLDRAMVTSIPEWMLNGCLNNSAASYIVGPRMIRYADQYLFATMYLTGRNYYLDHVGKENEK